MSAVLFEYESLFARLADAGLDDWADELRVQTAAALQPETHGLLADWKEAWAQLPTAETAALDCRDGVRLTGEFGSQAALRERLMTFHPWRKGPFQIGDLHIDTEWRSDWKWERLAPHVELRDRLVLDVGSGNGYYGWRMLAAGAATVVGLDPFLLYVMQHEAIKRLAGPLPNYVLPLPDECLATAPAKFDVAFDMGVLYHRASPIEHLKLLASALKPGGQLVLETLVVEGDVTTVLMPRGRYAKMRNVWFLPSVLLLERWLQRTGFRNIQVHDVTPTSIDEQRSTDWMTFESLPDFLNADQSATVEGDPPPTRAILTAERG
ncbi:MAG: tRNA 5-methoxyuridine(34)/uridine 5-oxyacetic acid(34) synthase CmoB [Planctomycetaceae bacterium]|nr:tRNA 5-methoxyuridine(34)/uridine 5-oxyacetic acid(34) synthase CmoB [Planctomycetaceae bacterium]